MGFEDGGSRAEMDPPPGACVGAAPEEQENGAGGAPR